MLVVDGGDVCEARRFRRSIETLNANEAAVSPLVDRSW